MPAFSTIPNRTSITLSVDAKKRKLAFENNINISLLLDAALERELNVESKQAFTVAMERQNKTFKDFIDKTGLHGHYQHYKYGETKNVVEKESEQPDKSATRILEGI